LGFQQKTTKEFHFIRKELLDALDRSFWRVNPERVEDLLRFVQSDPEAFVEMIDDSGRRVGLQNYAHEPIFVDADPVETAHLFFSLQPEITHMVLGPFEQRVSRQERELRGGQCDRPSERDWLLLVRKSAQNLASETTPIRAAQIRMAIKWHLSFLDKSDEGLEEGGE
jgi:hypothetical protein